MADETKVETTETGSTDKSRREFVKKSAQVAVTAPAVAMLLNATTKPASAQITAYNASQLHILDDFTSGNDKEDIDALKLHTNTINGQPAKDDTFILPPA